MINTLLVTVTIEGIIGICYSLWQKKPVGPIFFTSTVANLFTQLLLWIVLTVFYQYYLAVLFAAEFLIWILEGVLLGVFRLNKLNFREALSLSLMLNLSSFIIGWWLPI